MSSDADFRISTTEVRFSWTVRKPLVDRYEVSPVFNICDRAFKFKFHYDSFDSFYLLYLNDASGPVCSRPFKTSVDIAERSGTRVPHLTRVCLPSEDDSSYLVRWEDTVLMKYIPNFNETQFLRLDIVLSSYSGDFHLEQTTTDDKSAQTPLYWEDNLGLESLSRDISKLLITQGDPNHDIKLKCGDNIHQVHRSVLSSRSDVFAAMLRSGMTEELDGLVEIKDVDPDIFSEFLGYLYSGKISSLTFEKAMELYEVGDKYAVGCLMDLCASFLTDQMVPENILKCLVMADAHSDEEFKEKVISYILDNKIHLHEDVWLPFCNDNLKVAVEVLNKLFKMQNTE